MSFFEDIASALDAEGIESRVNDDVMFVPITSDVEIQFVEIDPIMPAANVYIAAAAAPELDVDFEAALVSVVFSVEDAVRTVAEHVATDQVVTILRDLLESTDERIADLTFLQDPLDPSVVIADVADSSQLIVEVTVQDAQPVAAVTFATLGSEFEERVGEVVDELWDEVDDPEELSDAERERIFYEAAAEIGAMTEEVLELGSFSDPDRLFDVLSLAADHAEDWESQLMPLDDFEDDEPDVYDIFGEDDEEE
ncbi:hypothetical protein [Corynebacterium gerontici]|uniref:Uncharacterized protein n=1 Tax=Corynebacterium gerontici TaxID=2079234 RepID=A0A3G6J573_9CORY|nr:hypothetical protein [Corynebacterium gerontici]AZA11184.1 hypothetical protein CGERO_04335 [Corynebacterium gerontici]